MLLLIRIFSLNRLSRSREATLFDLLLWQITIASWPRGFFRNYILFMRVNNWRNWSLSILIQFLWTLIPHRSLLSRWASWTLSSLFLLLLWRESNLFDNNISRRWILRHWFDLSCVILQHSYFHWLRFWSLLYLRWTDVVTLSRKTVSHGWTIRGLMINASLRVPISNHLMIWGSASSKTITNIWWRCPTYKTRRKFSKFSLDCSRVEATL